MSSLSPHRAARWRAPLFLLLATLAPSLASAQVADDFADGDLMQNPAWTGDLDRWATDGEGSTARLRTSGRALADTLILATPSEAAYGTWELTFSYEGVNLSNLNGARIFLVADTAALRGDVRGYFLQLGANNGDEVRLYRQDGSAATRRVELGRSSAPLLSGEDGTLRLRTTRSAEGLWTVEVGGEAVLEVVDAAYTSSAFFGLWVKHSSTKGQAFFFDDLTVTPGPGPADTTPPRITGTSYAQTAQAATFQLAFSERVDMGTVDPFDFSVSEGLGVPDAVVPSQGSAETDTLELQFGGVHLQTASYVIAAGSLSDQAGNALRDTTLTVRVTVEGEDRTPPSMLRAAGLSPTRVEVFLSESTVNGCTTAPYQISGGIGQPTETSCDAEPGAAARVILRLGRPLEPGVIYTLIAQGLQDAAGNVQERATVPLLHQPLPPTLGDLIVNEIASSPSDPEAEFVELFNRSGRAFDLASLALADSRREPTPVPGGVLAPGGYAVLARDSAAFMAAFPGLPFTEVAPWPALNNGGDTVILYAGDVAIDSVAYASSWGQSGASLERVDPDGLSNHAGNWAASADVRGGTPGAENTRYAPDRTPPRLLFAEAPEAGTVDVVFDEPLAAESVSPSAFRLGGTRPASATLLRGETLLRLAFDGDTRGVLTVEGVRDLTGNLLPRTEIRVAQRAAAGDLVVNEILFAPRADAYDGKADQTEYVELFNRAPYPVSLSDLTLTDRTDEHGEADTLHLGARLVALPPGGYAVAFAWPEAESDPSASPLVQAFPVLGAESERPILLPVERSSLGLRNDQDRVAVHARVGSRLVLVDAVDYAAAWHNVGVRDATGFALERLDPEQPSNEAANWTTSVAADGGTPGMRNSVAAPLEGAALGDHGVVVEPSPFSPDGDGFEDMAFVRYVLSADAALIRARIFDARGRLVRDLAPAALAGRSGHLVWNGLDDEGRRLRLGIYVVYLEALDARGGTAEAFKAPVVLAQPMR